MYALSGMLILVQEHSTSNSCGVLNEVISFDVSVIHVLCLASFCWSCCDYVGVLLGLALNILALPNKFFWSLRESNVGESSFQNGTDVDLFAFQSQ